MPVLLDDITIISFDIKNISYNTVQVKSFAEKYIFLARTSGFVYNEKD